ncbi:MAG TPA: hypothetical protein VFZ40_00150 [Pyrinomonadaceae bacterium]
MQWSKLKSRIKSLIAPELRERVDFHLTSYRESHDGADKVWIEVDGARIFDCKYYLSERATAYAYFDGLRGDEIKSTLADANIHSPQDFGSAMRAYLDMPVDEALKSSDPIVRAFAIVDRRVGKRTLAKLNLSSSDHSLIKAFYDLRCRSAHI